MQQLRREVGLFGAVMMGLGSIVGTGVFVSIGLGAEIAGPAVVLAIGVAALVAAANGLSSAQLAASHPVSGGTYEYGYKYLNPRLGFTAGWMFLCAKSASAATAALGFGGYLLNLFGVDQPLVRILVAVAAVAVLTAIILAGIRSSNRTNTLIVSITLAALLFFVVVGLPGALQRAGENLTPFFALQAGDRPWRAFLHATALMFVAYTGYGRIATLGEEVREPQRTIPRAIVTTLLVTMLLYVAVGFTGVAYVGADAFAELYRLHVTRVYRYFMAHIGNVKDAEDLTSQTFMAAMEGIRLFRGEGSFAAWVMGIASKKRLMFFRRNRHEVALEAVEQYPSPSLPTDKAAMQHMRLQSIAHALHQISIERSEAIVLVYFGGLTHAEAARVMKKNESAVKMLVSRGLQDLRERTSLRMEVEE